MRSACLGLITFVAVQGIVQTCCASAHSTQLSDPELFTKDLARKRKKVGLGAYVGTISEKRGADYLLKLADDYSLPVRLLVLGRFLSAEQREKYEKPFKSHPRIEFHEDISHNRIPELLSEAQFGLSLLSEDLKGLPTKLIEYMALQCAIITTDSGPSKELVTGAGCGIVVNRSYPDIRMAVEAMINDPGKAGLQEKMVGYV